MYARNLPPREFLHKRFLPGGVRLGPRPTVDWSPPKPKATVWRAHGWGVYDDDRLPTKRQKPLAKKEFVLWRSVGIRDSADCRICGYSSSSRDERSAHRLNGKCMETMKLVISKILTLDICAVCAKGLQYAGRRNPKYHMLFCCPAHQAMWAEDKYALDPVTKITRITGCAEGFVRALLEVSATQKLPRDTEYRWPDGVSVQRPIHPRMGWEILKPLPVHIVGLPRTPYTEVGSPSGLPDRHPLTTEEEDF